MKKINCAVIGMGVGARHADFYKNYKYTNLIKIFEKDKKKWTRIKKIYPSVQIVKNENEIFKDPNIKLVSIASYDNYHYAQILKSIKFKKNIFVEKPICLYLSQLKEIKKRIEKNNTNFSCNFILREYLQFKKIKKILKKQLGKIFFIEGDYNYGRLEKIEKGWRGKIPYYSVTHGGAIHMIDLILWFLNELPHEVTSEGNRLIVKNKKFKTNDFTVSLLKFKSGKIVKISSNFGCTIPHHHSLKVFGSKGSIIHDLRGGILARSRNKAKKLTKFNHLTNNEKKANVLKNFVMDILKKRKKTINENCKSIFNSMLVSLAIEKSIKERKKITINYKTLNLNE